MVEYLSGGRLQGSSTASATPTYPTSGVLPTGSTTTDWTLTDTTVSNSALNFDSAQASTQNDGVYDLGSALSNTKWVVRFKYTIANLTNGNQSNVNAFLGLFSGTGSFATNQNYMGLSYYTTSSTNYFWASASPSSNSTIWESSSTGRIYDGSVSATTYYVEIKRTSASTGEISIGTNSDFVTGRTTQTTFYGSISSSITGLRYIGIKNRSNVPTLGSAVFNGTVSDIEVYDGVTSAQTDEKDDITNVPTNTRYEETDTRKIFRRTAGTQSYNSTTTNVTLSNSNLTATSTSTAWGNRAYSTVSYNPTNIPSGETREFKFTMGDITKNGFMGFDSTPTTISGHGNDNNASGVDYGMYLVGNGSSNNYLEVSEQGTNKYQSSSNFITSNTIFKITVDSSGVVKYYADDTDGTTLRYTSLTAMSGDFYVLFYPYDNGFTTTITSWSNNPEWKERNTV